MIFPYEGRFRGMSLIARPSDALVDDLYFVTVDELDFPVSDFRGSDRLEAIKTIVGPEHRLDALHLDSAYRTGCQCFFTRDKRDILAKRETLEDLLEMRLFHPDDDWNAFMVHLNALERAAS